MFFFNWAEAYQAGPAKTGGKGWNLGRLARYGFPVSPGGVISAEAYDLFMEENNLMFTLRKLSERITLANLGENAAGQSLSEFRDSIMSGIFPLVVENEITSWLESLGNPGRPVAVRSSATLEDSGTASFAGIHDSFLNIAGIENITVAIKSCYASLWSLRALSYRRKLNIPDEKLLPATVIMDMVKAESAGIGFTCDPKTGRQDVLVINANYGLGESVVGGMVEPDEYQLSDGIMPQILVKSIGKKEGKTVPKDGGGTVFLGKDSLEDYKDGQVLADEDIFKLALLIQRVFEALGEGEQHQDVEWVYNGRDFSLVQSRPVTTLPRYTYPELKGQPNYWSNANLKDALPMVLSTLSRSCVDSLFRGVITAPLRVVGYPILPGIKYTRFYQGRIYMNLSLQQWKYFDSLGFTPAETNEVVGGYAPEIQIPPEKKSDKKAVLQRIWRMVKLMLAISKFQRKAKHEFIETRRQAIMWFNCDLTVMSELDLLEALEKSSRLAVAYTIIPGIMNASFGLPLKMLTGILEKSFSGKGSALANDILTGQGAITTAEHGYRLIELAEAARKELVAREFLTSVNHEALFLWEEKLPDNSAFKQAFQAYLEEYGHRAVYESDLANPRWREDPTYLLGIISSMLYTADSAKIRSAQQKKREKGWRDIRTGAPLLKRMLIRYWSGKAVRGMEMREEAKSGMIRMGLPFRIIALDTGRRLVERGALERKEDVFNCSIPDLAAILAGHWDGQGLAMLVEDRKKRKKYMETLTVPDLLTDETPWHANATQATRTTGGYVLSGIGISTGRVTGVARLIHHPDEGNRLNPGEVLVAPSTDPGWTPLFLKAAALIMETGGSLSHGAIVAREFGIPAVINVPGAMVAINDSQTVIVDGEEGKVYLKSVST